MQRLSRSSLVIGVMVVAAPVLAFPQLFPGLGVWGAVAAVIAAVFAERHLSGLTTPLDLSLAIFVAMAVVGTAISPAPDATLQKATGLLLGVAVVIVTPSVLRTEAALWRCIQLYLATVVGIVIASFPAMAWSLGPGGLGGLTSGLPQWLASSNGSQGVNPNAVAAAVLCGFPLLTVLVISRHTKCGLHPRFIAPMWVGAVGVLVLTQSMSAWVAAAVTTLALGAALRRRMFLVGSSIALGGALVIASVFPFPGTSVGSAAYESLDTRTVIWGRAVWALQDFPLTGVGLGAFRRVVPVLYPLYDQVEDRDVTHAHNQFLQVALDVGVPGLVAYIALLVGCGTVAWTVYRAGPTPLKELTLGLSGNLVALQIFGLTDAVALGAKIGVFFWLTIGLLLAAHRISRASHTLEEA